MIFEGLTTDQVEKRIKDGKVNKDLSNSENLNWKIVKRNTLTFFNLVFLTISILLILVQAWNQLIFLPIIIINTLVGIYQEIKSKNFLEEMNLLNSPKATVIRNSEHFLINSDELVKDDVIVLKSGNQIVADAKVIEGSVSVNESLLTGETDEIEKNIDDKLLSGSFIVSGEAIAILEKVGNDSYISQLSKQAKSLNHKEDSQMLLALDGILKWVSFIILPIACILFTQNYFVNNNNIQDSVVAMTSAIIGMIPEGLYLLVTLALTMSSVKLAKNQVLLHNMKSIESLSRVDVLCVDKTGTITEPKMFVQETFASLQSDTSESDFIESLSCYVASSSDDNETMKAIRNFLISNRKLQDNTASPLKSIPFSSKTKYGAVIFNEITYLLGAPEIVLSNKYDEVHPQIENYLEEGYRVLVLAQTNEQALDKLTAQTLPLGFVVLTNPIRENAVQTFNYFEEQGVQIKVISGDNPRTVSAVSKRAGIKNAEKYIDATLLKDESDIQKALRKYTVFGRVTPDQKKYIVQALQKDGCTVGMTGDGVNDILAMKSADCSIAMASGSEAATQVAQVVLLDSDFGHMPQVVAEGRRVVNNVQRSAILFLVKNMFSIMLALISAVFVFTYPIKASQLSLISLFTIGIPGFLLSLEDNNKKIEKGFIKKVIMTALPASLTQITAVLGVVIAGHVFKLSSSEISTSAVILLSVVGFIILSEISTPLNNFKKGIILGNIIAMLCAAFLFSSLFSISKISLGSFVLVGMLALFSESIFRNFDNLIKKYFS